MAEQLEQAERALAGDDVGLVAGLAPGDPERPFLDPVPAQVSRMIASTS